MRVDCREYRMTMELLSLKMQLEKGVSDPVKRLEIEKRIKLLNKELKFE